MFRRWVRLSSLFIYSFLFHKSAYFWVMWLKIFHSSYPKILYELYCRRKLVSVMLTWHSRCCLFVWGFMRCSCDTPSTPYRTILGTTTLISSISEEIFLALCGHTKNKQLYSSPFWLMAHLMSSMSINLRILIKTFFNPIGVVFSLPCTARRALAMWMSSSCFFIPQWHSCICVAP